MSETDLLKFIVKELGKPPFSMNYNVAAFASILFEELFEVLKEILAEIDPSQKSTLHVDDAITRTTKLLRVLRYRPAPENDRPFFVQDALDTGDKEAIWDIMGWLLSRLDEMKKRAYLAKFLTKIDIPDEFLLDNEMRDTLETYENLIEQFKSTHKIYEQRSQQKGISTLTQRSEALDIELESVKRRLDATKARIPPMTVTEKEDALNILRCHRKAKNECRDLELQGGIEEKRMQETESRVGILKRRLQDLKKLNMETTPEGIVQRTEQDNELFQYIVNEKLPGEINDASRAVTAMELIECHPPDSFDDLEDMRITINATWKTVQELQRATTETSKCENLIFSREQANFVRQKRVEMEENLKGTSEQLQSVTKTCDSKRRHRELNSDKSGLTTHEKFKMYVRKLKGQAAGYKIAKSEMNFLKKEVGILATTKFIMEAEHQDSIEELEATERCMGFSGISKIQEKLESISEDKALLDQQKLDHLGEMSVLYREMFDQVQFKRIELQPVVKTILGTRQECEIMEMEWTKQRNAFDNRMRSVLQEQKRLQEQIEQLNASNAEMTLELTKLEAETKIDKEKFKLVECETQEDPCVNFGNSENNTNGMGNVRGVLSYKDKLLGQIIEQERRERILKEELDSISEFQDEQKKQLGMWIILGRVLENKINNKERLAI